MAEKKKKDRILYFIQGSQPSPEAKAEAEKLGAVFRNANYVDDDHRPEPCDAVCGAVPAVYKKVKGVKVLDSKVDAEAAVKQPNEAARKAATKPWEAGKDGQNGDGDTGEGGQG